MRRLGGVLVTWLALTSAAASAQGVLAELRGAVVDASGGALPGATVTATNVDTGASRTVVTSMDGSYTMPALPIGMYRVSARLDGFAPFERQGLRLGVGEHATLDIAMKLATLTETVMVVGEQPLIETTKSELTGRVDAQQVESLPLSGRNWVDLVSLVPGARGNPGEVSVGAAGGDMARYQMDGLNVTGAGTGIETSGYSAEAIGEFQVLTNRFDAQYGQVTGAVVNAVTKSGTNTFHGSSYVFLHKDWWDATNHFLDTVPKSDVEQIGATLGGPVARDKWHFFLSYEYHKNGFTSKPSTGYAAYDKTFDSSTTYNYVTARSDNQLNDAQRLFTRASVYTWDMKNSGIGGALTWDAGYNWPATIYDVALGHTWVLGNRWFNEIRGGMWGERKSIDANRPGTQYYFPSIVIGTWSNIPQWWRENNFQLNDTLSYFKPGWHGDHRMKLGAQVSYQYYRGMLPSVSHGIYYFSSDPSNPADPASYPAAYWYTQDLGNFYYEMKNPILGVFAQDDWSVSRRLTLNLGVRYDLEPKVYPDDVNPLGQPAPEAETANIAPRVGFAWDIKGTGATVVRGGIGRYYGKVLLDVIAQQLRNEDRVSVSVANPSLTNPLGGKSYADYVNDPTILRDTWVVAPDYKTPKTDQISVGVAQQLGKRFAVQVDYVRTRSKNLPLYWNANLNPNPGNPTVPCDPSVCGRPYPRFQTVYYENSHGRSQYDGLQVGFQMRRGSTGWTRFVDFQGSYTFSRSKGHADGNRYGYILNQFDVDDDYGRLQRDQRHRFTFNGTVSLPWNMQLSPVLFIGSPYPIDANTYDDPYHTGWTGRWLPNGTTIPKTGWEGTRNDVKLDLRIQQGVHVGRTQWQGILDVFNLLNRTNYGSYQAFYNSPNFLQPQYSSSAFYQNRTFQLGLRVSF